jgi:hypothetical protein
MNTSLVKSAPQGEFVKVSPLIENWEIKLKTLVSQRKPVKFDMFPETKIPSEIIHVLVLLGYQVLTLEYDRWQHFLVPNSTETA